MADHDTTNPRRVGRRRLGLFVVTAAVGASLAGTTLPADAAPVAALTDITTVGIDTVVIDSSACNPDGSGTFTFTATSTATGSFPGTLTETGTVVLGPAQVEPTFTPVLSYQSSFEIAGPNGTVTGTTELLDPATGFFGSLTLNQGACVEGGHHEVQVETTYVATIELPEGSTVSDSGVGRVFVGVDRPVSPSNVTTLDLESTAGYPAPDPGLVTVRAEGVVEYVDGVAVQLGDPYVFQYTFEQSTAASYRTRTFATFPAVTSMSLMLGGSVVTSTTGTIAVSDSGSGEYRVDAYRTLTEVGGPLGPAAPIQLFLGMGGNQLISELGIPLDPTALVPQYDFVAIQYRDPDCFDCPSGLAQMSVDRLTIVPDTPADPDLDDDGIADVVDADGGDGSAPDQFRDASTSPVTTGRITQRPAGMSVAIDDAPAPDGVTFAVSGGPGLVRWQMCGIPMTLSAAAGSSMVLTCGSAITQVLSGQVVADLGNGSTITMPAGSRTRVAAVSGTTGLSVEVQQNAPGSPVLLTRNGSTVSLVSGAAPVVVSPYTFSGFGQPIDGGGVLNVAKGGSVVPVKWRLTRDGAPVTTLGSATIVFVPKACPGSATPVDEIEQTVASTSALMNLGNGNYQINWRTPRTTGCGEMRLDLGDGVAYTAQFRVR